MNITNHLHQQHIDCDDLFVVMEEAAQKKSWNAAEIAMREFIDATESHFRREETLLFPALEAATGSVMGPTQMMRLEHAQMRGLFDQMTEALSRKDGSAIASAADTLLILMQQHNMKEENILYPMCDRALTADQIKQVLEQEPAAAVSA
jgi:hemerythrin-like domain-containing protein